MKKYFIYFFFILCLIKLYHIADISLNFSTNLLINSFKKNSGEEKSLNIAYDDIGSINKYLLNNNIKNFKLSEKIILDQSRFFYHLIEFNYPIIMKKKSNTLIAYKTDEVKNKCQLIHTTKIFNLYDCK